MKTTTVRKREHNSGGAGIKHSSSFCKWEPRRKGRRTQGKPGLRAKQKWKWGRLERKEMEKAVKTAEERYRSIFLNATEGIFQITLDGRPLAANPALARLHGFGSPEELYANVTDIENQVYVDAGTRKELLGLLAREGRVTNFECRMRGKGKALIWVSMNARVVRSETGRPLYTEGTIQDITQRKVAEQQVMLQRDVALKLAAAPALNDALPLIVETAMQAADMDSGGIYLSKSSPRGDFLELVYSAGLSDDFVRSVRFSRPEPPVWSHLSQGNAFCFSVPGRHAYSSRKPLVQEGLRSVAIVPILHDGRVAACLNVASHTLQRAPLSGRPILEFLAAGLGLIIARLQSQERIQKEVTRRRETEKLLKMEMERLRETKTALAILLKHREQDREDLEQKLVSDMRRLVLPHLSNLNKTKLSSVQAIQVELIQRNLNQLISPFINSIRGFNFTNRQLEIITLIKDGKSTKEIAEALGVATGGINIQRFLIRKKLGLNNDKRDLRTYLLSIT